MLLVGLAAFVLSLPIAFFLFLAHFNTAYPKDTQNLLSALTAGVLTGLGFALIVSTTILVISLLFQRLRPARPPGP